MEYEVSSSKREKIQGRSRTKYIKYKMAKDTCNNFTTLQEEKRKLMEATSSAAIK